MSWSAATWALVLTALTLLLMIRQTQLAEEQTKLARRQTVIIEKQDEILARRAVLVMGVHGQDVVSDGTTFHIVVQNDGRRSAPSYFWEFFVPEDAPLRGTDVINGRYERGVRLDGATYTRVFGYSYAPLFPKKDAEVFSLKIAKPEKGKRSSVTALWEAIADDGVFPGTETRSDGTTKPGRLTMEVVGD